jgi:outer membrane receptor for ferrienterochelin and colicin
MYSVLSVKKVSYNKILSKIIYITGIEKMKKNINIHTSGKIPGWLAITLVLLLLNTMLLEVDAAETEDKAKLNKFQVTGTHIKRSDIEGPSPIEIIDTSDIEQSGATTLYGILSKLTISNGLMLNENKALSTTPGSAAINLRGLGQDATLVLLNGRRMTNYPFPLNTTDTFVDLNSIPLAAVERIEILKDGASATYGSDALAGVVNIILKKDYDGADISASYGVSAEGDAEETHLNFVKGISGAGDNITFSLDYFKRESFLLGDRNFSETANQTIAHPTIGIDYRSPYDNHPANYIDVANLGGTGIASFADFFDPNPWISAVPETERVGGILSYKRDISPDLTFFTDLFVSRATTEYQASPSSVWGFFDNIVFPAAHPQNPESTDLYLFWRMTELGPRTDEIVTNTHRIVAGFEGIVHDWDWEAGIFTANAESELTGNNYVSASTLQSAFNAGLLNPFGTSSQADLDTIRTSISRDAETTAQGVDVKFSGEIGLLDAGPVMLAVGASYLDEEMKDTPDAVTASGDIIGQGSTESDGNRNSRALFTELNLPLRENVEMQLALRAENYSDFGSTVNPKVAVKYRPTKRVMLRASAGTGFRAPSLPELHQSDTLIRRSVIDTARCEAFGECDPTSVQVLLSSNPDLDAEESTSYYLGALFEPNSQMTIAIDYWNYDLENIVTINTQDVVDQNDPDLVIRSGPNPTDPILGVFDKYVNSANRKIDGIDFEIQYKWSTDIGEFQISNTITKVFSAEERIRDDDPYTDYAGKYQFPDLRSVLALNWSKNVHSGVISANYISSYEDFNYDNDGHKIDSYLSYDGQYSYSGLANKKIVFGINNILDEDPPFSNGSYSGYDTATHDPTGRFYYARLNYMF